ncbi:MAG: hypothetical protein ACREEW_11105, partial [Caulobacteraceae bacterium]
MRPAAPLASLASALAALTLLAACGHSPPTQFFTLDPTPSSGEAIRPAALVQLAAVHIPALL